MGRGGELTPLSVNIDELVKMAASLLLGFMMMLGVQAALKTGGLSPVPVDDAGVVNASRVAEKSFNDQTNDLFYSAVSNVKSAQVQVVAGLKYYLTLELRTTVCRKRSVSPNCPFHKNPRYAKTMTCNFEVWEQVWRGWSKVTKQNCTRTAK
ncbi:cystatin-2-like [Hypanus sabinus]|uniref:cystatin-2-like n=1 Tax=Hypanus sabinus TaxID=79690 RepID=UPI0028C383A5|nr:cystatin-2-like [Hypanus sabinus]